MCECFSEYVIIVTDGVINGKCGETANWSLTTDGTLTISGTGAMDDYGTFTEPDIKSWISAPNCEYSRKAPWDGYKTSVKKVVVNEGITHIGICAFSMCRNASGSITIPSSVKSIGAGAFQNTNFSEYTSFNNTVGGFTGKLIIPEGVEVIGAYAFAGNVGLSGDLNIPNSVTQIGYGAFRYCKGLTGVRRRITIGCNSKLKSRLTPIRPRGLACNCTFLSA